MFAGYEYVDENAGDYGRPSNLVLVVRSSEGRSDEEPTLNEEGTERIS
jgi:hypothetical protein